MNQQWDAFNALNHRLSPGGYIIVDDFGCLGILQESCDGFPAIQKIDWTGVYWRRG